jgi:type IX secretion system PorP/SprF family membrane protein
MLLCGIVLLFALLFFPYNTNAQTDIHFSQFYETALLRNPALTGVFDNNYKVGAFYRSQWESVTYPYETMQINGEYRLSLGRNANDFISIGALGYMDKAGDLNTKITAGYLALNYNKSINTNNNSYLSVGFVGGHVQYSFDPSKATYNNQFVGGVFDPVAPSNDNLPFAKMSMTDAGAGVNYNFSSGPSQESTYIIGISCYHFTQPLFSYYRTYNFKQNIRWNLNGAAIREVNENVVVQLHANFAQQGSYSEIIGGGLVGWRQFKAFDDPEYEIYAGLLYRYNDAFIPIVKLRYRHAAFGISYDVNTSTLKQGSNMRGGLEVCAFLSGNYPPGRGYKKTVCPRFN